MRTHTHRLTTHSINELLDDYQLDDLMHYRLTRTHPKMYFVMDEQGVFCSGFMFLTEAFEYITSRVRKLSIESGEEYQNLYYFDENNEKQLISNEEDFEKYLLDNSGRWDGGVKELSVYMVEFYSKV